jgi:hypothetical protein
MSASKMINIPKELKLNELNDGDIEQFEKDMKQFFLTNFLSSNAQHKLIAYARTDLTTSAMKVYIKSLSAEIDRLSKEYLDFVCVLNSFPTFSDNHSNIECAVIYILLNHSVMFIALPPEYQTIDNVLFFIKQSTFKEIENNNFFEYIRDDIKNDLTFINKLNRMKLLNEC